MDYTYQDNPPIGISTSVFPNVDYVKIRNSVYNYDLKLMTFDIQQSIGECYYGI